MFGQTSAIAGRNWPLPGQQAQGSENRIADAEYAVCMNSDCTIAVRKTSVSRSSAAAPLQRRSNLLYYAKFLHTNCPQSTTTSKGTAAHRELLSIVNENIQELQVQSGEHDDMNTSVFVSTRQSMPRFLFVMRPNPAVLYRKTVAEQGAGDRTRRRSASRPVREFPLRHLQRRFVLRAQRSPRSCARETER